MAYTSFRVALPFAGEAITQRLPVAADTYYIGMPVKYNDTNDNYEYTATDPEAFIVDDQFYGGVAASANDEVLLAVSGSDILGSLVVNDSGAALTITDDIRQCALTHGIRIR